VDSIVENTATFLQQRTAQKVEQANIEAGNAQQLTTTAFGFAVALAGLIARIASPSSPCVTTSLADSP
jgi:hypothetical protein